MTFSQEWDNRYKGNMHLSVWPWSDLVSYVKRYFSDLNEKSRILELGCGAGANIPFFNSLGVQYHAIEGSNTMVDILRNRFPSLSNNIIVGDFTQDIPFDLRFDLIVDRSSLTHNNAKGIKNCLDLIHKKLKTNGEYIGIDWFSTLHSEYQKGKKTNDIFTRTRYEKGPFANVGQVHFSDKLHLLELFRKFSIKVLEHKIVKTEIPDNGNSFAFWNLVAEKKELVDKS